MLGSFFKKLNTVTKIILALAAIGLIYQMTTNPIGLITRLFWIAFIIILIYFIYRYIVARNMGYYNRNGQRYRTSGSHAYSTSKPKPSAYDSFNRKRTEKKRLKKKHKFKVIQGNKGKK